MSDTSPHSENRPLTAFAIVIGTVSLFASGDILIKYLTTRYPVELIMAIRSVAGLLLILAFFWPRMGRTLWQIKRPRLVLCRGLVLVLGSLLIGHALRLMPVGETISILYSFPILVMILAIPLMGEQVSAINWGFAVLGFTGVLMVARPGGGLDTLGVTFALLTAKLAAIFHLMTRVISMTETSHALLFHTILISVPCSFLLALFTWEGYLPNLMDFGLMALLGLIIIAAHYLLTVAYKYAPASLVAPANWVHIVWAALLGWLFFDHLPDQWTILGMLVIIAAGVGIAIKTHRENLNHPTGTSVS
tara:strand:- start:89 stop:1003 length:915 start_codon:yes stop_codon:yes gene_type:complete